MWLWDILRGYVTVEDRRIFGVVFPILKWRQLRNHCSDNKWYFSKKRISVTRIITTQVVQIERKWDLIPKPNNSLITSSRTQN